jgi:hypothetical protein
MYSDLVPLLEKLGKLNGDKKMRADARMLYRQFVQMQLPDGSFPSTSTSIESYVRGTGKVCESLALSHIQPASLSPTINTLKWLSQMQYDEDNTYFISPEHRKHALGGFRHDAHNPGIWVDSTAHTLLLLAYTHRDINLE